MIWTMSLAFKKRLVFMLSELRFKPTPQLCCTQSTVENDKCTLILENTADCALPLALPHPRKYTRPKKSSGKSLQTTCHGAILSISKPYVIYAVSTEILHTFGYTHHQLCGRGVCSLYGPRTDNSTISTAIKKASLLGATAISVVLYTLAGDAVQVSGSISPFLGYPCESSGECLLQIDSIHRLDGARDLVHLIDHLGFSGECSAPPMSAASAQMHQEAKLRTGLDNEAELRRRRRHRPPTAQT